MSEIDKTIEVKWQPVMLVVNRRVECQCGSIAIFVSGQLDQDEPYNVLKSVDVWCQSCFQKEQERV